MREKIQIYPFHCMVPEKLQQEFMSLDKIVSRFCADWRDQASARLYSTSVHRQGYSLSVHQQYSVQFCTAWPKPIEQSRCKLRPG